MSFEMVDSSPRNAVIKVIGVGGGGGNAVQHMVKSCVEGVDFIAANTDAQALDSVHASTSLQLGATITKGLGAGASPEVGRQAAMEDRDRIHEALSGADMVFVTAGMGGGTGTGAAPVVAEVAKELGALAVAVVTRPFGFENRTKVAEQGIAELSQHVDSVIAVSNDKLQDVLDDDASMDEAFAAADDVLLGAVRGISDIIIRPGRMNVDFADVRTVMSERGMAIMGTGQASGSDRASVAIEEAVRSPLLEGVNLSGARGVVVNVTTAPSVGVREFHEIGQAVRDIASKSATLVIGTVNDEDLGDEMRVTIVATGLSDGKPEIVREPVPMPAKTGTFDYAEFDRPTVMRRTATDQDAQARPGPTDADYLDIPAFLRRQAD